MKRYAGTAISFSAERPSASTMEAYEALDWLPVPSVTDEMSDYVRVVRAWVAEAEAPRIKAAVRDIEREAYRNGSTGAKNLAAFSRLRMEGGL